MPNALGGKRKDLTSALRAYDIQTRSLVTFDRERASRSWKFDPEQPFNESVFLSGWLSNSMSGCHHGFGTVLT